MTNQEHVKVLQEAREVVSKIGPNATGNHADAIDEAMQAIQKLIDEIKAKESQP